MTLSQRIKASAEELGKLLREAEQVHQAKMRERDTRISADSNDLFDVASEVDLILRNYPARKALMVLDICKILVTARY